MKPHLKILIIVLSALLALPVNGQSKLKRSKHGVKQSANSDDDSSSIVYSDSYDDEDKGTFKDFLAETLLNVAWTATFASVVGIYDLENHLYNDLSYYPYSNGFEGNYISYDSISEVSNRFRLDLHNQFLYENETMYGNHFKLKLHPFQYFYLQADYHQLTEYNDLADKRDYLALFHFNFNYDRLRLQNFDLGWSMGVNYIANDVQKAGFNLGANLEYFPSNPISVYGSGKWGWINGSTVNLYEFNAKYHLERYVFSMGYEHLKIGEPRYNFFTVGVGMYLP